VARRIIKVKVRKLNKQAHLEENEDGNADK